MSSRNLVSNLGFGTHGTHTRDADGFGAAQELEGVRELSHPGRLTPDPDREAEIFEMVFGGNRLRFPHSLYHVPRLMMGRYYRWLRAVR